MDKAEPGFHKLNVDGVVKRETEPGRNRGVVHDDSGRLLLAFSKSTCVIESNEVKLLAIGRAIFLWSRCGNGNLIIEEDSVNAIASASGKKTVEND